MLPGLGPTEGARPSPAPHPLLPKSLTLGSATLAMGLAPSSWGDLGFGEWGQAGRGWEKDGTAEQEGEQEGVDYYSKCGLWIRSLGITWEPAGTSNSQPPP